MAGRYKRPRQRSQAGYSYSDRAYVPDAPPCDDNVDVSAPTDMPERKGRAPKGERTVRKPSDDGGADQGTAQCEDGESADGEGADATTRGTSMGEEQGRETEEATRGTSSSSAIRRLPPEYLSRRHGASPITERTRANILSRVSPIKILEHVAKGRPMLTTWVDPKSGETKDIWVRPSVELRVHAAEIALDRVAPRLRAIEVSGETAQHYRLTIEDVRGLLTGADPATRAIADAEWAEIVGEDDTPDNDDSRESGEQQTDGSDGQP